MTKLPLKILFAGKKRAGKDISAAYLLSTYGGSSYSFAAPIYNILHSYQDTIGITHSKDRDFLKLIGDHARKTNPSVWINLCIDTAAKHTLESVYITDGRYENELNACREAGFTIVHIKADDDVRASRLDAGDSIIDGHSSENGFAIDYPFDFTVENNGTIKELHNKLDSIIKTIRGVNEKGQEEIRPIYSY